MKGRTIPRPSRTARPPVKAVAMETVPMVVVATTPDGPPVGTIEIIKREKK